MTSIKAIICSNNARYGGHYGNRDFQKTGILEIVDSKNFEVIDNPECGFVHNFKIVLIQCHQSNRNCNYGVLKWEHHNDLN